MNVDDLPLGSAGEGGSKVCKLKPEFVRNVLAHSTGLWNDGGNGSLLSRLVFVLHKSVSLAMGKLN